MWLNIAGELGWAGQGPLSPPSLAQVRQPPPTSPAPLPHSIHLVPTMTVVSSEALAMTLSLCGHQSMSSTGAVCPVTSG